MAARSVRTSGVVPALRVRQWVNEWNKVRFNASKMQGKPDDCFYLFAMNASTLKSLTGVYRRSIRGRVPRSQDPNVQRAHDEERSNKIRAFVEFGFPWCELPKAKRETGEFSDLRKPGWLPTAIVVNILRKGEKREGVTIADRDRIRILDSDGQVTLQLPDGFDKPNWRTSSIPPLEVIDGQHRLWAFEGYEPPGHCDLPVVAFEGLDRSWQAYLFWSINITPKRIKQSLAFDLYPLLRTEDWLDRFEGHAVYRETRAQELVEALWSHERSPWHQRINMLGESGAAEPMVSQAAWIRSLLATYVKQWEGHGTTIGGLFGAPLGSDLLALPWSRAQQAAFLILVGQEMRRAVSQSKAVWAQDLRNTTDRNLFDDEPDTAFYGPHSLLSTDQGIRGLLHITNDLCFVEADTLKLDKWLPERAQSSATDHEVVERELASLRKQPAARLLRAIANAACTYDWRRPSAPSLGEEARLRQMVFKGSGGYRELRRQLLTHLTKGPHEVARPAGVVLKALGLR